MLQTNSSKKGLSQLGTWLFLIGLMIAILTAGGIERYADGPAEAQSWLHFLLMIPIVCWDIYLTFLGIAFVIFSNEYLFKTKRHVRSALRLNRALGLAGLILLYLTPAVKTSFDTGIGFADPEFLAFLWDEYAPMYICWIILTLISIPSMLAKAN